MRNWPSPARATVFLDFDGTLVDIAATPDSIIVPPDLPDLLNRLSAATLGRVVLLTGRDVDSIQRFLPSFLGQIVGCHGADIWNGEQRSVLQIDNDQLARSVARAESSDLVARGLNVEVKPVGFVLHYRAVPMLKEEAHELAEVLCAELPEHRTLAGKMSVEIRPDNIGKERALADLMERPEVSNTIPMFFGDDTTDLPALRFVYDAGGTAGFVGNSPPDLPLTFEAPHDLRRALDRWLTDYE